jgi:hypothetical protein
MERATGRATNAELRRSMSEVPPGCSIVHGVDHYHAVVPAHERGHDHDDDHVHGAPKEVPLGGAPKEVPLGGRRPRVL